MEVKVFLDKEKKTIELGKLIGKKLNKPSLIYLVGDLGAGKTYLSKGIAKGLGIKNEITSPTFTLINEHKVDNTKIYHLDLYRLSGLNEVLDLGIEDFVDSPDSIVLIEWADKLNGTKFSKNLLEIEILHEKQGRTLVISSNSELYYNLLEDIKNFANTRN